MFWSDLFESFIDWLYHWGGILLAVLILFFVGTCIYYIFQADMSERAEFITYCTNKGHSQQDCKWEYKRLENGQRPIIIMPIITGR